MKGFIELAASKANGFRSNVPWPGVTRFHPVVMLIVLVTLGVLIVAIPFVTTEWAWLPKPDNARTLLATLLTAQAAIAALTLAVTQFVLQAVSARRDADDQMYREYLRQSRVQLIFWGSIVAVGITGIVFTAQEFVSGVAKAANIVPGLGNLTLVAALSFAVNLVLPIFLFEKALRLTLPGRWSALRRIVNESNVHRAVQAFLSRNRRVVASLEANQPDVSATFPDPDEGLADEAIRALLGDARRAMSEHQQREFTRSLQSIRELISYAMDEIELENFHWQGPGRQAEWPPLRDLGRSLDSFREAVIIEGNREYLFELLGLDYWLTSTGARRHCGEMFTAGLEGYQRNYQLSNHIADEEIRGVLRDRVWLSAHWTISEGNSEEVFPYALELVRHQERMLSDALRFDRPEDFEALHKGFSACLRFLRWDWGRRFNLPTGGRANSSDTLEQFYRVFLMGLAGRAIMLAELSRLAEPVRYLDMVRVIYSGVRRLADDIGQALLHENLFQASQWSEWEWEGAEPGVVQVMAPEQYPLTFFVVRLMELSSDTMPGPNLHGSAGRVLNWFESNSDRLLQFVSDRPDATREEQRAWASRALREAVKIDEVAEDNRVIESSLSSERVSFFKSEVYANAFGADPVERIFEGSGAFWYLPTGSESSPEERGYTNFESKGFLASLAAESRHHYAPLEGDQWGHGLANDIIWLFCEALDGAPETSAPLDCSEDLLRAFDKVKTELEPSGELIAVLAGNWTRMEIALNSERHEGYVPGWQIPDADEISELGRYNGHALLRGPRDRELRLYLVDPRSWGCFVRAQCEGGQDLRIDINPISEERARELLDVNPNHFPDEPEYENKLRKLQTFVELAVGHRIEFRVKDHSRARRVVAEGKNVGSELTEA